MLSFKTAHYGTSSKLHKLGEYCSPLIKLMNRRFDNALCSFYFQFSLTTNGLP